MNDQIVADYFTDEVSVFVLQEALDRALIARDEWLSGKSVPFVGTVADQMRVELVAVLQERIRERRKAHKDTIDAMVERERSRGYDS